MASKTTTTSKVTRMKIDELPLPIRARRGLARAGAKTLGDVLKRSEEDLLVIDNFAEVSLNQVKKFLQEQGLQLRKARNLDTPAGKKAILDSIKDESFNFTFREREILGYRYGVKDGISYTLEEVGKMFDLTRERVRQVQKYAEQKVGASLK